MHCCHVAERISETEAREALRGIGNSDRQRELHDAQDITWPAELHDSPQEIVRNVGDVSMADVGFVGLLFVVFVCVVVFCYIFFSSAYIS